MLLTGEVKFVINGAVAKASPNRAPESVGADAKLCDLSMSRMKEG